MPSFHDFLVAGLLIAIAAFIIIGLEHIIFPRK